MGNSANSLPFDVGVQVDYPDSAHWTLSRGNKKDDNMEEVSIFRFIKSQHDKKIVMLAQRALQKLRTLKHPYILQYVDGADFDESTFIVTECCDPLANWLQKKQSVTSNEAENVAIINEITWGVKCILTAVNFLHTTCKTSHNYMGPHAIFICKTGDWKLASLDLSSNLATAEDKAFYRSFFNLNKEIFISPEQLRMNYFDSADYSLSFQMAGDVYSLSKIIGYVFDYIRMVVPVSFAKLLQKMSESDVRRRPSAAKCLTHRMFTNEHMQLLANLGELSIKPVHEAIETLGKISANVSDIPQSACLYKILPSVSRVLQMAVNDFANRDSRETCRQSVQLCLSVLVSLIEQDKLNEKSLGSFNTQCLPILVHLWSMSDRAVRSALLKTLKPTVALIPDSVINKTIFDHLLAGFADSNAKMREETLKSLVHLIDKLEATQLQDKLVRCLTNLQADAEASIRTNACIFLGRVAPRLKEGVRARVLCPFFVKSMRDATSHCRIAGLKACLACLAFMDATQLTSKIMPQACLLLLDKSSDVRTLSLELLDQGTLAMRSYNDTLLQQSKENGSSNDCKSSVASKYGDSLLGGISELPLSSAQRVNQTVPTASWASWAVEGLSKTLEKATVVGETIAVSSSSSIIDGGVEALSTQRLQSANVTKVISSNAKMDQGGWDFEDEALLDLDDDDHHDNDEAVGDKGWDVEDDSFEGKFVREAQRVGKVHMHENAVGRGSTAGSKANSSKLGDTGSMAGTNKPSHKKVAVIKLTMDKSDDWDDF